MNSTENIRESIKAVEPYPDRSHLFGNFGYFYVLALGARNDYSIVTIPLALVGTFAIMYIDNFSINTLTLLAMVLAIGLVVDDAIVVLENIYRHIEKGGKTRGGRH